MSFASDSGSGMGRPNGQHPSQESAKMDPSDDAPLDLSMPRYPNASGGKVIRAGNSYFANGRCKRVVPSYDVDASDQPIDYSKKYVETNASIAVKSNYVPRNSLIIGKPRNDGRDREKTFSMSQCKIDNYGDYAETDLDQPTDYSLRYAEDDADDDGKRNTIYFVASEQEDTIKTYCTEGTPLNFSNATSMSDLRVEEANQNAKKVGSSDLRNNNETMTKESTMNVATFTVDNNDAPDKTTEKSSNIIVDDVVINSMTINVDKPINYNDEGTPGVISRVSSLSSLGCAAPLVAIVNHRVEEIPDVGATDETASALPVTPISSVVGNGDDGGGSSSSSSSREETEDGEVVKVDGDAPRCGVEEEEEEESAAAAAAATCGEPGEDEEEEEKDDERGVDKEGKVVTFGGEDHYAEETPLMFSRSSSLGSLSGFEQQSIHDDRSSIVSDFRTSGIVSPSELPDSPTQTVPPSPRHNHRIQSNDLPIRDAPSSHRNFTHVKNSRTKISVFEDNTAAFKEESTPIEFSGATSLSSLTIDDDQKCSNSDSKMEKFDKARTLGRSLIDVNNVVEPNTDDNGNQLTDENVESRDYTDDNYRSHNEQPSDDDEDEDILAACINMGMRNTTYRKSLKEISELNDNNVAVNRNVKPGGCSSTNLVRYQTSSSLDRLDVLSPILKNNKNVVDAVTVTTDTLRVYCTEDTPADISPVGSQSNLSALSMLSINDDFIHNEHGNTVTRLPLFDVDDDDETNSFGEDDKILNRCIQSGIPKSRLHNDSLLAPSTGLRSEFSSSSEASATTKTGMNLSTADKVGQVSSSIVIETNEIPIDRESFATWRPPAESAAMSENREDHEDEGPSSFGRASLIVDNDEHAYGDSPNNSDDDAILTECILSAMPKAPKKTSEASTRHSSNVDEASTFASSHSTTQVFHDTTTRVTIGQTHETDELFTDTSSLSEDEEDLILAQCIRSGMPKASTLPSRIISVKKDDRGNND